MTRSLHRSAQAARSAGGPAPCVFCEIIAGREPATLVAEWPDAIAIVPLDPVAEGHTLVIPRTHVTHHGENPQTTGVTAARFAELCARYGEPDNHMISNMGRSAGQSVNHLHLHYLPRAQGDGVAMPWHSPACNRIRRILDACDVNDRETGLWADINDVLAHKEKTVTHPLLRPLAVLSSLSCEPYIPDLAHCVGLPGTERRLWYGEGGPGLYQIGTEASGETYRTVFFFGTTDIGTRPGGARDLLVFSALGLEDRVVIALPEISQTFAQEIRSLREVPVHLALYTEDGGFEEIYSLS